MEENKKVVLAQAAELVKKTIIKNDEFVESLKLFKKGMLEKQYDSDLVDTCSLDNTIRLINQ